MINRKRGQGLSTNAIILIILGIIVLGVLIVGFSAGWKKLAPWISNDNVKNVVTACQTACSTQSQYEFCSKQRTLISDDLPNDVKEVKNTCKFFATTPDYAKYGIKDCPGLC